MICIRPKQTYAKKIGYIKVKNIYGLPIVSTFKGDQIIYWQGEQIVIANSSNIRKVLIDLYQKKSMSGFVVYQVADNKQPKEEQANELFDFIGITDTSEIIYTKDYDLPKETKERTSYERTSGDFMYHDTMLTRKFKPYTDFDVDEHRKIIYVPVKHATAECNISFEELFSTLRKYIPDACEQIIGIRGNTLKDIDNDERFISIDKAIDIVEPMITDDLLHVSYIHHTLSSTFKTAFKVSSAPDAMHYQKLLDKHKPLSLYECEYFMGKRKISPPNIKMVTKRYPLLENTYSASFEQISKYVKQCDYFIDNQINFN
jgi:hypothetical protein